jgi:hypothetical protein
MPIWPGPAARRFTARTRLARIRRVLLVASWWLVIVGGLAAVLWMLVWFLA